MDIFIGNIPYDASVGELRALFARHGHVSRVHLPVTEDGRPSGIGFATMPVAAHATSAIAALDGHNLGGRALRVSRARRGAQRENHGRGRGRTVASVTGAGRSSSPPGKQLSRGALDSQSHWRTAKTTVALLVPVLFVVVLAESARLELVSLWVCAAYAAMALVTFLAYARDKAAAHRGGWRVAEANLHLLSLAGGWPGAFFARHLLRHKTVKRSFRIVFALTVVVNCASFGWLFTDDGERAQRDLDQTMSSFVLGYWSLVTDSPKTATR